MDRRTFIKKSTTAASAIAVGGQLSERAFGQSADVPAHEGVDEPHVQGRTVAGTARCHPAVGNDG